MSGASVEVFGPVELEWMNAGSYYFYDPDGNLLEFWNPNSASSRVAL
jgi:catechol 2,3-dioxygenase-like lactoylglutathione lyase family enzyme